MMRDTLGLCRELQIIRSVIGDAGNPPKQSKAQTIGQCEATAEELLQHIETAEHAASTPELRDRLHDETVSLLTSIKRHVRGIVRCTKVAPGPGREAGAMTPADETLREQFEDLRDKSSYPLMDVLRRVSSLVAAKAIPEDALSPEDATRLFCVTRETLRQAVQDGELQPHCDAHAAKGAQRRFSEAQLARLYARRL